MHKSRINERVGELARSGGKNELSRGLMGKRLEFTRREFMKGSVLAGAGLVAPRVPVPERVNAGSLAANSAGVGREDRAQDNKGPDSVTLENQLVRIELNPDSGDITGLYNKRTGREYIADKKWARAFRLNVPFPKRVTGYLVDYSANSLDSWRQAKCTITKTTGAESQTMVARYSSLESEAGKFQIEVNYSIRLPNNSDEAILQLELTNHSSYQVKEVFFPWISGVGAIEGEQTDTFVAPNSIRSLDHLRKDYGQMGNLEEYPYLLDIPMWPGGGYSLSMPWMNWGGREEGLCLASLSRECLYHMLMIQDFGDATHPVLAFAWAIPPYVAPGKSWRTPEMLLSLHRGDWHVAADKYRATLAGWYQKPDTPPEFKKAFASFNSLFTTRDFAEITDLAEDIRKYGLQDLVMWNFGDYYPKVTEQDDLSVEPPRLGLFTPQWGGLAKLRAANEKAHDWGVRTGIIFSQRLWNKDTLTPELRVLAEKWVMRRESGDPLTQSWDHQHLGAAQWSGTQQSFGHLAYMMCDAVKDWQNFAIHNILGVLGQADYSMMFYDEAVEAYLCFSPGHDHSDVSAPCMATAGFFKSLKAAMRESNSSAILMGEGWEVMASQTLDAGWVWSGHPNPEVFRYTLPWAMVARAVEVDAGEANRHLVLGIHMAIVAKSLENGKKLSDFPEFAQHLARLASFHERTERFWVGGTFQDDLGLRVSGAFAKVYETPDEAAIMMANLTNQAVDASFELDSHRYAIGVESYSTISSSGHSESGKAEKAEVLLKGTRSLAPYEVIAVIFGREAQRPSVSIGDKQSRT